MFRSIALVLIVGAASGRLASAAQALKPPQVPFRVGDAGSVLNKALLDPEWPDMAAWADAGVRGGIPHRLRTPLVKRLRPGQDIQKAVDDTAARKGGVVLLAPGRYPLEKRLDLLSGVILRGEDPDKTILEVRLRTDERWEREIVGIRMLECKKAALEDLTVLHPAVEKIDPKFYRDFKNDHLDIKDLRVGHVFVCLSEDCWIQNCRLLYAGTDPVVVNNSTHITLRDNVVKYSFNKGDKGNGYYLIHKSQRVLCFNEHVEGLRHFTVQTKSAWNAIIDCRIIGDLNFHSNDGGHNLVEGCAIERPAGHQWGPIGYFLLPRGDGNVFYRNDTGKLLCPGVAYDPSAVISLTTNTNQPVAFRMEKPPPAKETFYPVMGARDPKRIKR